MVLGASSHLAEVCDPAIIWIWAYNKIQTDTNTYSVHVWRAGPTLVNWQAQLTSPVNCWTIVLLFTCTVDGNYSAFGLRRRCYSFSCAVLPAPSPYRRRQQNNTKKNCPGLKSDQPYYSLTHDLDLDLQTPASYGHDLLIYKSSS